MKYNLCIGEIVCDSLANVIQGKAKHLYRYVSTWKWVFLQVLAQIPHEHQGCAAHIIYHIIT